MKKLKLFITLAILTTGCANDKVKNVQNKQDTTQTDYKPLVEVGLSETKYSTNENWVDDFKNFRQAIYTKNNAKLKSYFKFPIVADENSSLWYLVQLNDADWKKRKLKYGNKADLFYEEDFDKFANVIFDSDFKQTIMKIKTDKLLKEHYSESPKYKKDDYSYQMLVDFQSDEADILYLNMSFGNTAVDENGENVSEGEHNNIYKFEVIDGKKIIFNGFTIAG